MDPDKIFPIVVQLLVLLFAISFHESAHALTAFRFGDPTAKMQGRISLNPLRHIDLLGTVLLPLALALAGAPIFGWAKPTPVDLGQVRNPRLANLWISAAGPLSNLFLGSIGLVVTGILRPLYSDNSQPLPTFLWAWVAINFFLAFMNLIPLAPLDGSGIVASLLRGGPALLYARLNRFGFLIFIGLMFVKIGGISLLTYLMLPAILFVKVAFELATGFPLLPLGSAN